MRFIDSVKTSDFIDLFIHFQTTCKFSLRSGSRAKEQHGWSSPNDLWLFLQWHISALFTL